MKRGHRTRATEHLDDDRLIDLVGGLLSAGRQRSALRHLRECPACEGRFRSLVTEWDRVSMGDQPVRVGARFELRARPRFGKRPRLLTLAATGSLAAGLALAAWMLPARPGRTPIDWRLPVEQTFVHLRAATPSDESTELLQALEAYHDGQASRAAELLSAAQVPESYAALRDIYLASALILSRQSARAEPVLDRIGVETLPQPWRGMTEWLVYVTLQERGETDKAGTLLDRLCEAPGEVGRIAREERERR